MIKTSAAPIPALALAAAVSATPASARSDMIKVGGRHHGMMHHRAGKKGIIEKHG